MNDKNYIQMDYFDWDDKYRPLRTKEGDLIDVDPRGNNMSQEDFNTARSENRIWTALDVEGDVIISNGLHFVNRLENYVCEVPYESNKLIEVD
jgi:hypothetical protein